MGRDGGLCLSVTLADLVFLGFVQVVGELHSFHIDGTVCGIIELQPVIALEKFVDEDAVRGTYLVDTDGCQTLCSTLILREWGEAGYQRYGALILGQLDDGFL